MIRWCCGAALFALASIALAQPVRVFHGAGEPRVPAPKPAPFGGLAQAQPPAPLPNVRYSEPAPTLPRSLRPPAPSPFGPGKPDRNGDPMPAGAIARFGTVRLRHGIEPIELHFTHDGKQLLSVSGTTDGIRLWDTATGKETARLELPIAMGAIAPNGQIVFSDGARCKVWSPATKQVRVLPPDTLPVNTCVLAIAPDSQSFALGTPGKIVLRDLQTGQPRGELNAPADVPPMQLVYSPDGSWLAGMGPNKTGGVWLWDLKAKKRVRTYPTAADFAEFAFSPSGDRIAIAGESLRIFPTDSEELPEGFAPPEGQVFSPQFSGDGKSVFAAQADATVVEFDAATGEEKDSWPPLATTLHAPITLGPNGQFAAATDDSGGIRIWNPKTGTGPAADRLPTLADPGFSADGKTVLVSDAQNRIHSFDVATGKPGPVIDLKLGEQFPATFDARTGRIAVAVGVDTFEILVFDANTGNVLAKYPASNMLIPTIAFDPSDPDRIALFSPGSVAIHSLKSERPLRTLAIGQPDTQPNGCFSPDGRLIAVTTLPLSVWEVGTGKKRFAVDAITDPLGAIFSPDGRLLAVWDIGDVVVIFDTRTGTVVRRFQLPFADSTINTVIFTPDSKRLVTGGRDGLITFWDVASGEPLLNLDRHDGLVTGLRFSKDGTRLVSTSTDGTALVWDVTADVERKESAAALGSDEALKLLGDADAAEAYRGMKYLAARPAEAVRLLGDKLPVPKATPPATVARLVVELGHDDFQTRRAAVAKLIEIGGEAAAPLREAAANSPNAEVRKLAEDALLKLDGPPTRSDDLRAIRAVEVLEATGRADAKELLKKWSAGPSGHRQTVEATAALKRLE